MKDIQYIFSENHVQFTHWLLEDKETTGGSGDDKPSPSLRAILGEDDGWDCVLAAPKQR